MKNNKNSLKSLKGSGKDLASKPLPPGTLFVVCLNKPLIDLWSVNNRYAGDYYDTSVIPKKSSVFSAPEFFLQNDDRIQGILSPEDEMLLYNEGLSDY